MALLPRTLSRSLLALVALAGGACKNPSSAPDRPEITVSPVRGATPGAPAAQSPSPPRLRVSDADQCASTQRPTLSEDWTLLGDRTGPSLHSLIATGSRRHILVGATGSRVCVSSDEGARWREALSQTTLDHPVVTRLNAPEVLLVLAQGSDAHPSAPRVFASFDDGARWSPLAMPAEALAAGARARVFTDRAQRLYVATGTKLWRSDDARTFGAPIELPGSESDQVDACGDTLIARAHIGADTFFHRSDDHGRSWRAFRLGAIGLEGGNVMLRCLGWRGGIEAGRAPLPSHWSFDQGRTWEPSRYDADARAVARALADDPNAEGEPPRCAETPGGQLVCTDTGRLVLPGAGRRAEVHAPSRCEHVRLLDDQRMVAFGPSCGLLLSTDRGGLWRPLSVSASARTATTPAAGRGGFITRDTAWRLDGGVWWTRDGGEHWRVVPSLMGRTLERGVFVDGERGVFAQAGGWVMATRDGGRTWTYVLRGEVERIASGGRWVMITTTDRVRLSSDGGETWRTSGTIPASVPIASSVELFGSVRRLDVTPTVRVLQQGESITLATAEPEGGRRSVEIARDLGAGRELVAAHATRGAVDRILLSGGAMLVRSTELSRR